MGAIPRGYAKGVSDLSPGVAAAPLPRVKNMKCKCYPEGVIELILGSQQAGSTGSRQAGSTGSRQAVSWRRRMRAAEEIIPMG